MQRVHAIHVKYIKTCVHLAPWLSYCVLGAFTTDISAVLLIRANKDFDRKKLPTDAKTAPLILYVNHLKDVAQLQFLAMAIYNSFSYNYNRFT